jgi:hypothetical protein
LIPLPQARGGAIVVLENKMLIKIFGPKIRRYQENGANYKMQSFMMQNIIRVSKSNKVRYKAQETTEKYTVFWWGNPNKGVHLEC